MELLPSLLFVLQAARTSSPLFHPTTDGSSVTTETTRTTTAALQNASSNPDIRASREFEWPIFAMTSPKVAEMERSNQKKPVMMETCTLEMDAQSLARERPDSIVQ